MPKQTATPSGQDIVDKDVAVHNYLLGLASACQNIESEGEKLDVIAMILAQGLSSLHTRIGEYFLWDRSGRS